MKRIISLCFLCLVMTQVLVAQNYTRMWKEVEQARRNDLPRSALAVLDRLCAEALQQKQVGHYLKAMLVRQELQTELSADSAQVGISLLQDALLVETNPASRALYNVVLGQLHGTLNHRRYPNRNSADSFAVKAMGYYMAAMADPDALAAARTTDYLPLIVVEKGSRYFQDDLLSVVARQVIRGCVSLTSVDGADSCRRATAHVWIDTYRKQGNREAVLLATLDSLANEPRRSRELLPVTQRADYSLLVELTRTYADKPLVVEAYVALCDLLSEEGRQNDSLRLSWAKAGISRYGKAPRSNLLRNVVADVTRPEVSFRLPGAVAYPGVSQELTWTVRNTTAAALKFYRLSVNADDPILKAANYKQLLKKARLVYTVDTTFVLPNDFERVHVAQTFHVPQTGVYLVQATAGGIKSGYELLYVSRVRSMWQNQPDGRRKVVAVDGLSGHPLPNAVVSSYRTDGETPRLIQRYTTNADGVVYLPSVTDRYSMNYQVSISTDAFSPAVQVYGYGVRNQQAEVTSRSRVYLYSDRGVYRPGQEIRFGGIAYIQTGDIANIAAGKRYQLKLYDANSKVLDTLTVQTDSMGTFSGVFRLPSACLNGQYTLCCEDNGHSWVRVESYKRPTFTVTLQKPAVAYVIGDTLAVEGEAKTYNGVALQGATVRYSVQRKRSPWVTSGEQSFFTGEAPVGDDGRFVVSVPLVMDRSDALWGRMVMPEYGLFEVTASVLGADGENQESKLLLPASVRQPAVEIQWAGRVERSQSLPLCFSWKNAAGVPRQGNGVYHVYNLQGKELLSGVFKVNEQRVFSDILALPSGNYRLVAVPDGVTDTLIYGRHEFVLFSTADQRPADRVSKQWFYYPDEQPELSDRPYEVQWGTTEKDVHLYYDLFSGNQLIESKCYVVSDTILRFRYTYAERYGDGLTAVFGFYREGERYDATVCLRKPVPEKKLQLRWTSFRNKLQPGQQEEWRLSITHPDGKPAHASLMATLYDASLEKFASLYWQKALSFDRQLFYTSWRSAYRYDFVGFGSAERPWLKTPPLLFSYLSYPSLLREESVQMYDVAVPKVKMLASEAKRTTAKQVYALNAKSDDGAEMGSLQEEVVTAAGTSGLEDMPLRTNFNETAFFYPQLRTDNRGEVAIVFTLPESLTAWNFKALAHDRTMNTGMLDTTVVAVKEFMIQGNLPRFLRSGDRTSLAFNVRNLSANDVYGKVRLELLDAETEKVVLKQSSSFRTAPQEQQVVTFDVRVTEHTPVLICRVLAEGGTFADGEQTYLPVLSDKVEVTETVPLTLQGTGQKTYDLSKLFGKRKNAVEQSRLTLEYTARPLWYAFQALPVLGKPETEDVLTLASAYYAASLAQQVVTVSPRMKELAVKWSKENGTADQFVSALERNDDLKQLLLEETPWVMQAENESVRRRQLADFYNLNALSAHLKTYVEKLEALQRADGSWSWFKGMPGSGYMTGRVAELLARLNVLNGGAESRAMLTRALDYLDRLVLKEVETMRKQEKSGVRPLVSESQLRYLWMVAHSNRVLPAANRKAYDYLVGLLAKQTNGQTMYHKALSAVVLQLAGYKDEARLRLQSVMEYTVTTPEMGRYFDTDRAVSSWASYRIPTQVAAIEALRVVDPQNEVRRRELLQWLIQAKRTQTWGDVRNSVDAVYALFAEKSLMGGLEPVSPGRETTFDVVSVKGRHTQVTAVSEQETGYFRTTLDDTEMKGLPAQVRVNKTDVEPAWGSVYVTYVAPVEDVFARQSGLGVKRSYQREVNGKWQPIGAEEVLNKGDKVRCVYTLQADRDYDFVCLKAPRPACLESIQAFSGYVWSEGLGAYREMKDASMRFFFERFPKGIHTVVVESRVDRTGTFQCGIATLQSVYAAEFTGHTDGWTIKVK